jgi:hypothetical protein
MRLVGQIHITVCGDVVLRDPSWWEKVKRGLGSRVELDTGEVKNGLEATAIVDSVRRALGRMGVSNALSLVIDDTVIFQDADGKPDDLPDLVLALSEHASVFGRGFRELRFAAEHEEAGLRLVIETRARTRHRKTEPAAVVSVGGRLAALEPARGESAEAYRARVEPLIKDATRFESARHAFQSFVQRLQGALQAALPDAEVVETKAETRLVKAPADATTAVGTRERPADQPLAPGYDPWVTYYPSPMGMVLDAMIFTSFMHMMMPPPVMVVSPLGAPLGMMSDVQAQPDLASDAQVAHADQSLFGADDGAGAGGDDLGGAAGDAGDGGAWWDSSDDAGPGGGDDGGGGGWDDGGGGDFGGGDGGLD